MNRTIMERVRCILIFAGMPKHFWGEAVTATAGLINMSPSSLAYAHIEPLSV